MTIEPSIETNHPEVEDDPKEPKKRISLFWVPATIGIGLLIAAIYLGGRIVTAHLHATPAAIVTAVAPPVSIQPPPVLSVPPVVSVAPEADIKPAVVDWPLTITPHAGERYIQVGALTQESARFFIQRLRGEKLEAHLAPGPNLQILRVLIGPFHTGDALTQTKTHLREEGLDSFVRRY